MRYLLNMLRTLVLLSIVAWSATVAAEDWIHGTWWYADSSGRVIEGEDKDGMRFAQEGTVDLIYGSGNAYLTCKYALVTEAQLDLDCIVNGKKRRLRFVIDPSHRQLANVEDTDNGFYRRDP